ncbi:MAG: serine/threonine protein kinase [Myxococcales bacterium]|nr:serine/threonine protein kinase [Myxococcales bacterium]
MIGQVIDGKYEVKALLGQGGMGAVYEAEHTGTGRRCAVKVIINEEFVHDPKVVGRFQREARAAGAVDTQYIAQVLDAGVDRDTGLPFLAMEYLDGEDVQHLLKRVGPIAPDTALRIVAQACLGLQKAHAQGVVHRDIKPHNLFLTKRDAGEVIVKILDFGIAKVKMDQSNSTEGADLTKTGNLLGSPLYVSPEQARGQREIDHRTDIWSLGAVLYQMLSGRTPYQHATALGELILLVCTEPPPPIQDHAPWVTPEVAAVVHNCLKQNVKERYQTAGDLFEAVRPLLPGGWTLTQEMLLSLSDSQRLESAPRLPTSMPPPAPMLTSSGSTAIPGVTGLGRTTALGAGVAAHAISGDAAVTTNGAAVVSQAGEPRRSSKLPVVIGAVALVAAAGVGIFLATRPGGAGDSVATAGPTTTTMAAPATATTAATTQATTSATATPADDKIRYKIRVLPKDATVEVDGATVEVADKGDYGEFEVTATVGDSVKVRVQKGSAEATGEVAFMKAGPDPAIVELKEGKKTEIKRTGNPGVITTSSAAAAPPKPTVKGVGTDTGEFGEPLPPKK